MVREGSDLSTEEAPATLSDGEVARAASEARDAGDATDTDEAHDPEDDLVAAREALGVPTGDDPDLPDEAAGTADAANVGAEGSPVVDATAAASTDAPEEPAEEEEVDPAVALKESLRLAPGDWYVVHSYAGYENKVKANLETRVQTLDVEDFIFQVEVPTEE